jgi:hypothetical protein
VKTFLFVVLSFCLAFTGCAGKKKQQLQVRRAYAAGEQAARAQMQQGQLPQSTAPQIQQSTDPQVRILGPVKNPVLMWSDGLTLAHALVEAEYQRPNTPKAITIYRNNQPISIDPQTVLQGADYLLFPGDIVYIQD